MAALQHANPSFLEEIFSQFTVSHKIEQVTKEPVLMLLDQAVEHVWITPPKTANNYGCLRFH
jgi:hypothetical protein